MKTQKHKIGINKLKNNVNKTIKKQNKNIFKGGCGSCGNSMLGGKLESNKHQHKKKQCPCGCGKFFFNGGGCGCNDLTQITKLFTNGGSKKIKSSKSSNKSYKPTILKRRSIIIGGNFGGNPPFSIDTKSIADTPHYEYNSNGSLPNPIVARLVGGNALVNYDYNQLSKILINDDNTPILVPVSLKV